MHTDTDTETVRRDVSLRPITSDDLPRVGEFLHQHLDPRLSARRWAEVLRPTWVVESPNHGFLLESGGAVVGAYLAIYSERVLGDRTHRMCNLAAWCVLEEHRGHAVRLVRAMLRQPGYTFLDLSPSGNVVALNSRLGFTALDTATVLVPNLPLPHLTLPHLTLPDLRLRRASRRGREATPGRRRARVLSRPDQVDAALDGPERQVARDHRSQAAALVFVVRAGQRACLVVARRDRRKGWPLFASLLHVSDPEVFARAGWAPYRHLLRHGALVTLAELRVVGARPRWGRQQRSPRPKMFRSRELAADQIDYLYSELTCVPW